MSDGKLSFTDWLLPSNQYVCVQNSLILFIYYGLAAVAGMMRVAHKFPHINRVIAQHEIELLPLRETDEACCWQKYQDLIRAYLLNLELFVGRKGHGS